MLTPGPAVLQAEIDDLLQSQMRLQDEFSKSQVKLMNEQDVWLISFMSLLCCQEKMLASAQQLERVMKDLDENADVLTYV